MLVFTLNPHSKRTNLGVDIILTSILKRLAFSSNLMASCRDLKENIQYIKYSILGVIFVNIITSRKYNILYYTLNIIILLNDKNQGEL